MLTAVVPKWSMRDKMGTRDFDRALGFEDFGHTDDGYLGVHREQVEISFVEHRTLAPHENGRSS